MHKNRATSIIGRVQEQEILDQFLKSSKSEFLALYGRRRVGKTYLVRNFFENEKCIFFQVSGIKDGKLTVQLSEFAKQIGVVFYGGAAIAAKKTWFDTFEELTKAIQSVNRRKKVVLFFDEFPWMATPRSNLLEAVEYYWNRFWVNDSRLKLILCGSAASWIIDKIINNKGALYNRITRILQLIPFSLNEVSDFLAFSKINLSQRQILELYMAFGGIAQYLALIRKGKSAHQMIDELCFQKSGHLVSEFDRLFESLFKNSERYSSLVRIIAQNKYGIGQAQLIQKAGLQEGGRVVKRLKDLENCGFIASFIPHGHQEKGIYYKVIDEFVLFYLYWIEPNLSFIRREDRASGLWLSKMQSPSWRSWSGYAFEAVCYKHLAQIRKALCITPGVPAGTWRFVPKAKENQEGVQIDLLFDRQDHSITVCEIKYTEQPFVIDKQYAKDLLRKVDVYKSHTQTQKQIFIAMISANGLKPNMYSEDIISQQATLEDLLKPN